MTSARTTGPTMSAIDLAPASAIVTAAALSKIAAPNGRACA
jgi:hypothetical protein